MLNLDLKKNLGNFELEVKCSIPLNGITAIFGRSGSGKTSLINMLSGILTPDSGSIYLNDTPLFDSYKKLCVPIHKRNIGYVFQDARLFPHYNVRGNLTYGQKTINLDKLNEVVKLLDIELLLDRHPASLSGGEKQRIAIGRALLANPKMLLLDEPLSSLDLPRKRELLPYLERMSNEINIPIIYITHGLDEILRLADQMLMLSSGKLVAMGDVNDIWGSPVMRPWLPAKEHSSLLQVQIVGTHPKYALTKVQIEEDVFLWIQKVPRPIGEWVRIRLFSNDLSITLEKPKNTSIRNIIPVRIAKILYVKERAEIELKIGNNMLWSYITCWAAEELKLEVGKEVYLQLKTISIAKVF